MAESQRRRQRVRAGGHCANCTLWARGRHALQRGTPDTRAIKQESIPALACPHLGERTGEVVGCRSCRGLTPMETYRCALHGLTVLGDRAPASDTVKACRWCPDRPVPTPAGG